VRGGDTNECTAVNRNMHDAMTDPAVAHEHADGVLNAEHAARLAFIYQEALRGLAHQQGVVENMSNRAGSVIFAASFVTSLLGARALSDGAGPWDWLAMAVLFAIGGLVAFMLWPYHNYVFRFDPADLLQRYADGDAPTAMSEIHRTLALQIKRDMAANWRIVQRLRLALQVSLLLLLLEILAWFLAIAQA
jgi:hypothetical protein